MHRHSIHTLYTDEGWLGHWVRLPAHTHPSCPYTCFMSRDRPLVMLRSFRHVPRHLGIVESFGGLLRKDTMSARHLGSRSKELVRIAESQCGKDELHEVHARCIDCMRASLSTSIARAFRSIKVEFASK
mmetsp:Transcript_40356/g.34095  ORF Transcript_40356/g.34095 Transcript_40356/m.34095 type:complete len:129 (-) Transcript_40356:174-560(-)